MANNNDAFIPELWAEMAVDTLYDESLYAATIHREFEDVIGEKGDTVHTRQVAKMSAGRKQDDLDNVQDTDASATNIKIPLDQTVYISFILGDGDLSKSMDDLIDRYVRPAMEGQAEFVDRIVASQVYKFLGNRSGSLGQASSSNVSDYMLDARQVLNDNSVPLRNRWLGLASPTETHAQKVDLFKSAERVGDGGMALREALLGRKHGFGSFLSMHTPSIKNATVLGTENVNAAAAAGSTSLSFVTGPTVMGTYVTVVGDYTALRCTSTGAAPNLNRPTHKAIANGAAATFYTSPLVNQSSPISATQTLPAVSDGYPKGWATGIAYDGSGTPQLGQLVSFSKADNSAVYAAEYGIVKISGGKIWLDRPLEDSIEDNAKINLGPNGDFNFAYDRGAVALVSRPLVQPKAGLGVLAAVSSFRNISTRVVISYDTVRQGHRVTIDMLLGVKELDLKRGSVMYG